MSIGGMVLCAALPPGGGPGYAWTYTVPMSGDSREAERFLVADTRRRWTRAVEAKCGRASVEFLGLLSTPFV